MIIMPNNTVMYEPIFTFKPKFAAGRGGGRGRFVRYTHDALSKILGTGS